MKNSHGLNNNNDINPFAKNEKELDTLVQAKRIYNQDIGIEFTTEKYTMLNNTLRKG